MNFEGIPYKWNQTELKNVADRIIVGLATSVTEHYRADGVPIIRNTNISGGKLDESDIYFISREFAEKNSNKQLKSQDVVTVRTGPNVGMSCVVPEKYDKAHTFTTLITTPNRNKLDSLYLAYYLNSPISSSEIERLKTSGGRGNLNTNDLRNLQILIPPLPEQYKITQILSTWDESIAKVEDLIAKLETRKAGLMQHLLIGRVRFSKFEKSKAKQKTKYGDIPIEWEYISIESLAQHKSTKNENSDELPVLSCTKYDGLVDSLSYFGRQVFSEDTSTYKVVNRGQFAYATNHIEEGSIGYQNLYDCALISPMYTVFETNNKVDDGFLYKLLKTELYRHIFEVNTSASIDRRGSLRWDVFSQIRVPLPALEEQKAISEVIDTCQQEINLTKKKLETLQQQKKGLMQKLLTGEIRVKV